MVGLTELRRRLSMAVHESLAQRIVVRYQATHGLPRKVNRIAHYALSAAALVKARQVSAEHVQSAVDEFQ